MRSTSPLKIGYVVKRYPRYSETFIVSEVLAHEEAGTDVRIFALRPSFDTHFQDALAKVRAPVSYLGFDHVRAPDFWEYVTRAAREFPRAPEVLLPGSGESPIEVCQGIALARQARAAGIDHLHAHFATSATAVARIASLLSRIPYTFTAHAKDIYHQQVDHDAFQRKLSDAAACVTVSDCNASFLAQEYAASTQAISRIYNGIDLRQFSYESPVDRPPVIVAVGRLVEKKGFGDVVDACAILRASSKRFTCRIVGTGPLESELRSRIEHLGLTDHVTLTGPRPLSEVIGEVQSAAAMAVPCVIAPDGDRDGLPTVMLEAMALGTPCVATSVTGIPEAILDEDTGLIVPPHDAAALAFALGRLLDDAALRVRLAEAARRHVESHFEIRANAASLRGLFAGVHHLVELGST